MLKLTKQEISLLEQLEDYLNDRVESKLPFKDYNHYDPMIMSDKEIAENTIEDFSNIVKKLSC